MASNSEQKPLRERISGLGRELKGLSTAIRRQLEENDSSSRPPDFDREDDQISA